MEDAKKICMKSLAVGGLVRQGSILRLYWRMGGCVVEDWFGTRAVWVSR